MDPKAPHDANEEYEEETGTSRPAVPTGAPAMKQHKHPMAIVLDSMGSAAREGRARRMREKFHKAANPGADQEVDPVKAEPELSPEDLKMLEDMQVQR